MTCELAFPRGIDPARLDENRYLESLVEQGAAAGLFSPEDRERLQNQAMGLLARQARKYTGGDTSLPRETAAELLKSALYTAGLALAQDAPETALQHLRGGRTGRGFSGGAGVPAAAADPGGIDAPAAVSGAVSPEKRVLPGHPV